MNELISRQAVIDACEQSINILEAVDRIMDLPSVSKTGHWIDHQDGRWIYAQCSGCGTVHDTQTNYCPNCGAKMESEVRNEKRD